MYIKHILITQTPKFEYKDNLHRIPKNAMRILLFFSFIFYSYHTTQNFIHSIPYLWSIKGNYLISCIIGQAILGALNLLVFEIVAKFYYGFLTPIQPTPITQKAFLEYLRAGYLIRNILGGTVKFILYQSNVIVFGFDTMINLVVTTAVLFIFCIYVIQKYVPFIQKTAFLKCSMIPYVVYQSLSILAVLL